MTSRETILFERAMNLIALEHGSTREEVLMLLNDDSNFEKELIWPKPYTPEPINGVMPFMQVTRTSIINPPNTP